MPVLWSYVPDIFRLFFRIFQIGTVGVIVEAVLSGRGLLTFPVGNKLFLEFPVSLAIKINKIRLG
jgi:hypothetical protein